MKSQALKNAWILFRKYQMTFSKALIEGWKQAKINYFQSKVNYFYNKRELLIEMNDKQKYTISGNENCSKYFRLMSFVKSEMSFYMRKKDSCLDKSNYKFTIPLNVSLKSI